MSVASSQSIKSSEPRLRQTTRAFPRPRPVGKQRLPGQRWAPVKLAPRENELEVRMGTLNVGSVTGKERNSEPYVQEMDSNTVCTGDWVDGE
jgi:hypothetical protein